jgi:catechol 2,3-dioxygenase-like lactoylglutathione lyase family enzyme
MRRTMESTEGRETTEKTSGLAVHHLAVVVHDLARAEAFYVGLLGLPVMRRWTDDQGASRSVWLSLGGGAFLAVERPAARPGAELPLADGRHEAHGDRAGWHCVALGIAAADRETWRARLGAGGAPVERETAYTLYARDPEGNLVGLSHYPDPAPPAAG